MLYMPLCVFMTSLHVQLSAILGRFCSNVRLLGYRHSLHNCCLLISFLLIHSHTVVMNIYQSHVSEVNSLAGVGDG